MAEGNENPKVFKVKDLTVHVVGDGFKPEENQENQEKTENKKKSVMITFHGVGMNHKTCFEQFLKHDAVKTLHEHFVIYHIDAPGQEPDAATLAKNYQYPSIEKLAEWVGSLIEKEKLEGVICFGFGAGAAVMAHLMISKWVDKIKGIVLVLEPVKSAAEEAKKSRNVEAFTKSFQDYKNSDLLEKLKAQETTPSVMIVPGKNSAYKTQAENLQCALINRLDSKKCNINYMDCGDNTLEKRPECMEKDLVSFINECNGPVGDQQESWASRNAGKIAAGVGGGLLGVGAIAAAPFVLAAAGFTSAGIAAGSLAASMMSGAAIANGGGVAAGSVVAVLQGVGAAGLGAGGAAAVGGAGAGVGAGIGAGVTSVYRKFFGKKEEHK